MRDEPLTVDAALAALRRKLYESIAGLYPTPENAGPAAEVADAVNDLITAHLRAAKSEGCA